MLGRLVAFLLVSLLLIGCGTSTFDDAEQFDDAEVGVVPDDEALLDDDTADDALADEDAAGCSPSAIGEEDGRILAIERVIDGERGPRCFGVDVAAVDAAWELLATITDVETRSAITHLVAFESEGDTLAFAGPVDPDDNSAFYVAVDAGAIPADPEFRVTVVHELAHVLTGGPDQLDATGSAFECETWFTGYGCPLVDSVIDEWVNVFWDDAALDSLPATGEPDLDGGDDRCSLDPGFIGPYAASHPEEDLAESFAAYVLDVDVLPSAEARLVFFDQWPSFVAIRDRARAADLSVTAEESGLSDCG